MKTLHFVRRKHSILRFAIRQRIMQIKSLTMMLGKTRKKREYHQTNVLFVECRAINRDIRKFQHIGKCWVMFVSNDGFREGMVEPIFEVKM